MQFSILRSYKNAYEMVLQLFLLSYLEKITPWFYFADLNRKLQCPYVLRTKGPMSCKIICIVYYFLLDVVLLYKFLHIVCNQIESNVSLLQVVFVECHRANVMNYLCSHNCISNLLLLDSTILYSFHFLHVKKTGFTFVKFRNC